MRSWIHRFPIYSVLGTYRFVMPRTVYVNTCFYETSAKAQAARAARRALRGAVNPGHGSGLATTEMIGHAWRAARIDAEWALIHAHSYVRFNIVDAEWVKYAEQYFVEALFKCLDCVRGLPTGMLPTETRQCAVCFEELPFPVLFEEKCTAGGTCEFAICKYCSARNLRKCAICRRDAEYANEY